MKFVYSAVRKDFEYLEGLEPLYDQVELDAQRLDLMQEPTRAKACELYFSAIGLWFGEHHGRFKTKEVDAIAARYWQDNTGEPSPIRRF